MKIKILTTFTAMLVGLSTALFAHGQLHTNGGVQYLLSQSKDMSQDFSDLSNHYFFADSLADFNPITGVGTVKWVRRQLMPRQAFNANTYLHQPLTALDFPNTAYDNDPMLQMSIDPVNDRTLRIRIYTSPIIPKEPDDDPMLAGTPAVNRSAWKTTQTEDAVIYTSANGSLEIHRHPWRLVLKDASGKVMTQSRVWGDNDSTQVKVAPFSFIKRGSDNSRSINPVFSLMPGERIYGCGESATSLNKAGQKVNLFVTDPQGPETPDMYKPIPFFLSNRGYGMFMHTSAPVTCDFGASYVGTTKLFMADEVMDIFLFLGDPKEVLGEYTALVGRPEMPPLWSFGTWMSRITYFSEAEGRDVANKLREHKIPSDVIHFDTGWFGVDWQCDYEFAADRFDNPEKMLADLKEQGFHTCLWQLPYFTPKNRFFPELVEKGLYVRNGRGELPYEDVVLDFTNPATVAWYQEKLGKLITQGVGAIKVDFGEGAPLDAIYSNGRSGLYEHNLYPVRYNRAVAEITKKIHGENIIWARSAWAGSQRYPLHWGGDAATTNAGFLGTIRAGLSLGLSGFCFWSNDIGGFVTDSPENLYRRWLPYGFLTSHSRVHGAPPTEPWLYGKEFTDYFRKCAEMKYKLMPYVYAQATKCTQTGLPMMRALLVEFPDDPGAWMVDDQYMFGESMLVAPMLEDGESRDVYLPGKDKWIDYQTGKIYTPGWNHIATAELPIVVLVKDGTALPHIPVAQSTDQLDWSKVHWKKYLADKKKALGTLCLPSGSHQEVEI
ncbi:MAG: alpha-xylosidase [Duncaniella sp.]|nr:alpha-xylosidase [Muribaculum sp.]MCM1255278.1 alpha-xylosidase [Duncaniella sp.]